MKEREHRHSENADIPVILLHNLDPRWDPADLEQARTDARVMHDALAAEGHPVIDLPVTSPDLAALLAPYDPAGHIVLNWCEELPGRPKSDAAVAELLGSLSYTYTGPTAEAIARSWDKVEVKRLLDQHGLSTPRGGILGRDGVEGWDRFPAIVKPSREHCSVGITPEAIVMDRRELRDRIIYVEENLGQPALVEDFIDGRELHVSLWGNGRIEMLPPAEMNFSAFSETRRHLCTYDSKFRPGSEDFEKIELVVPAPLDKRQYEQLEALSIASYRVMGCRDFARIDLRLRDDTFYVLDVNPNADLSSETSTAYAAAARGTPYGRFVSGLVNLAAHRHPLLGAPS